MSAVPLREGRAVSVPKLEIQRVGKSYGHGSQTVEVLLDVDLALEQNEFVAVIGASGCGKSTLLAIAAGLEHCDRGTVLLDGVAVEQAGPDRGVVFQNPTLLPWLTARQNIEFALKAAGYGESDAKRIAAEHLELVNLSDFGGHFPHQLSGGMKQRVAIARALSYRPTMLLMDEPFGALDAITRRQMQALLTRIWEEHRLCVLFVTHDVEEAIYLADRVVVMAARPGRVASTHAIPFRRCRDESLFASREFADLRCEVLGSIRHATVSNLGRIADDPRR